MSADIGTDTDMGTQTAGLAGSGCREGLIPLKQERHAVAVPAESLAGVCGVYGAVQLLVGIDQFSRHGARVVQVGQCRSRVQATGIQDGLSGCLDSGALGIKPWATDLCQEPLSSATQRLLTLHR